MAKTKTVTQHASVSLKLPKRISDLISFAQAIVKALAGNPSFPSPVPTVAALVAAITDLQTAQTAALSRVMGAVAVRDDKRAVLVRLLKQLAGYVQTVADATVENAGALIQSSAFSVRKTAVHKPRVFDAVQGDATGSAKLVAPSAGARSSYEWEYSSDGGKTWVTTPVTLQARTLVSGLTVGSTVLFRYRPVTKAGEGNWSQPIALVVK